MTNLAPSHHTSNPTAVRQPAETRASSLRKLRVAILGNPNSGKSTLFNALTGLNVRTGNYPGVTVEKRVGKAYLDGVSCEFIDLPGVYSLAPQAEDELIATKVVLGLVPSEPLPDVLLCIASAENLERHLFLISQALDLGIPAVVALNMWDSARARGISIDAEGLSKRLGVPVILTEAHRRTGLADVKAALLSQCDKPLHSRPRPLPEEFYAEVNKLPRLSDENAAEPAEFFYERVVLDEDGPLELQYLNNSDESAVSILKEVRSSLIEKELTPNRLESIFRYRWVGDLCETFLRHSSENRRTISDRLDSVLTHRFLGMFVFLITMFLIFQAIYSWSGPMIGGLEFVQQLATDLVVSMIGPGMLRSLLIDGVIAGVGTVLIFLPQIALLFLFIAILEDCGYMPRVAFMMDRLMSGLGLSGKAFIPLMSSFACAVPGVMATRVIENPRDRLVTVLVAPLMSCSARLPVYLLMISAFVPASRLLGFVSLRGLTLFGISSLGAIVAIPVALTLRRFLFRGEQTPFVLELPEYKIPSVRVVLMRVFEQAKAFVIRAGTLILATTVLVWAFGYFPGDRTQLSEMEKQLEELDSQLASLQTSEANSTDAGSIESERELLEESINAESARLLQVSLLGRSGKLIEPAVKPLGWDWKIGVGVIASFPAREVIISTLGTIYSLGGEVDNESEGLTETLKASTWPDGSRVYNLPVAISIMVFFALCAQCSSTLLVIRRETNSWKWPTFCFVYMTVLAYLGALLSYQIGMLFVQ